jgi:hypothetical protein
MIENGGCPEILFPPVGAYSPDMSSFPLESRAVTTVGRLITMKNRFALSSLLIKGTDGSGGVNPADKDS